MKFEKSPDTFYEVTEGEIMIIEVNTGEIFKSNDVGAFIWERIDGEKTVEDIVDKLLNVYIDIERETVKMDVENFLNALLEKKLIQQIGE